MADYIQSFTNYTAQGIKVFEDGSYYFPEELPQMFINSNSNLFFLSDYKPIVNSSLYGASILGILLLSLASEMLSFLKWFLITRKRITSNCLNSLVDLNKDQVQFKKD